MMKSKTLYLIKFNKGPQQVLKVGVTFDTVEERINRTSPQYVRWADDFASKGKKKMLEHFDSYEVVKTISVPAHIADMAEEKIKTNVKRDYYTNDFVDGITETRKYTPELESRIVTYMNRLEEKY